MAKHLVVALVDDGSGSRLFLQTQEGGTPEGAAARFLAGQDLRGATVAEFAVVEGVGAISISPQQPLRPAPR
jgi:hypothetical protein